MNRKCTLLATALLTVGTFMASAAIVPPAQWTAGNFYYLKSGANYLSLDGNKADSVVVKTMDLTSAALTKASIDSALWQISDKAASLGVTTYKFTNKATKQVLSFAAKATADLNLTPGVDKWVFDTDGILKGYYSGDKFISLNVTADNKLTLAQTGTAFTVEAPDAAFSLDAKQLGDGFRTFQLKFGDTYEGNIFVGEDLLAKDVTGKAGYVTLQAKGDESYADGKAKFFGVDTLKTTISGAKDVFGYKFALDSTRKVLKPNATWQQFKFTVNLQNDRLAMFAVATPLSTDTVRVVYASVDTKKVLTVSKVKADGTVEQGTVPSITLSKGTPAVIPTADGIYFLKSASKTSTGGKYIVAKNGNGLVFMGGDSVPSVNLARGQWYIKADNGKYSVVDRQSNTSMIINQEIFDVQGMPNTYVFGSDSVTVVPKPVSLTNKHLGSLSFTEQELADNGYLLNLISGTTGVDGLYAYTTDSILKGRVEDVKNAAIFKLIPADTTVVGGAKQLGDTLSVVSYKLRGLFNTDTIALQRDSLKFSKSTSAQAFRFISDATAQKFAMLVAEGEYVGMNISTSCVQVSTTPAYVMLDKVEAPEYAAFANSHKRLTSDAKSLVMNPLNFRAEMKSEGQEILKAGYDANNFSLWVEQASVVGGKQLYFITSGIAKAAKAAADVRYYLVSAADSAKDANGNVRALFITSDTIKTMKNSPALFAFKTAEEGGYYLENQKELNSTASGKAPYVGNVNGFAVMQKEPVALFTVDNAPIPTANEEINTTEIKVLGSRGELIVTNASGRKITLSNILGQTIGTRKASSDYFTMSASTGIVLVTVEGDTTYKVIVK